MKLFKILFIIFIPIIGYSVEGQNYVTGIFSGNFNTVSLFPNNTQKDLFFTGGFNLDLGHLYTYQDEVVHSMDTRVGFAMSFDKKYYTTVSSKDNAKIFLEFDSVSIYTCTTYGIGTKTFSGLLLVEILGVNFGYFIGGVNAYTSAMEQIFSLGDSFAFSLNLPLGIKQIFESGILIGFRHKLDFVFPVKENIGTEIIINEGLLGSDLKFIMSYTLTLSIGFVFGK